VTKSPSAKQIIPLLAGLLSVIIGSLVLWGWHTNNIALIQIHPDFAGMQYNSAFCFIVSGVALLAILKNNRWIPFLGGIFVFLVSGLTLVEYIFNVDIGIDQFFMKPSPLVHAPAQGDSLGRMSPNGAVVFLLMGVSLLLLSHYFASRVKNGHLLCIVFVMGLVSLVVNLMAILGYTATLPDNYGWGGYIQMAPHTACANILLSIGVIFMAMLEAKKNNISIASWSPLFVFITFTVMTLLFWDAAWAYVRETQQKQTQIVSMAMKNSVHNDLKSRQESLWRMSSRWQVRPRGTPYKEWYQDAMNLIADEPGYQALEWVDPNYRIQWVAPLKGNEVVLNVDIAQGKKTLPALQLAVEENRMAMTPILTLETGNKGFLLYAPVRNGKKFHGMIIGVIDAKLFFHEVFANAMPGYNIVVYANNQLVYQRNPQQSIPSGKVAVTTETLGCSMTVWADSELLAKQQPWLPKIILFVGFLIALQFSLIAYLAQIARNNAASARREIDQRKKTEQQLIVYSEKLKKLSFLDALTKTNNRRSLTRVVKEAITHLRDEGIPFSVLLLDIDHFKKINDTYGHVAGDHVLQKVGGALRGKMRAIDTIARYGGEEFCIVLPNALGHQAYEVAERFRRFISDMTFSSGKKTFQITCSIGVYQVHPRVRDVNKIFEAVDAALYKAKNSGRNCVVMG